MSLRAPYLLRVLSATCTTPPAGTVVRVVRAGLPSSLRPFRRAVTHVYSVVIASAKDRQHCIDVATYLESRDQQFGGAPQWMLPLCRIGEFAEG